LKENNMYQSPNPFYPHRREELLSAGGTVQVGTRVYCGLYGGNYGIVIAVHGQQRPGRIRDLASIGVVMGGSAEFDVVFNNHYSRRLPECIMRGVQWLIFADVATAAEIVTACSIADVTLAEAKAKAEAEGKAAAAMADRLRAKFGGWLTLVKDDRKAAPKNIRKQLKKAFPGVKFSVTIDHNSISVGWEYGPTEKAVKSIVNLYREGHFDGMTDSYECNSAVWPNVFGGVQYASVSRSIPAPVEEVCLRQLCELNHIPFEGRYTRLYKGEHDPHFGVDNVFRRVLHRFNLPPRPQALRIVRNEAVMAGSIEEFYRVEAA
jgi:hypothetical protein